VTAEWQAGLAVQTVAVRTKAFYEWLGWQRVGRVAGRTDTSEERSQPLGSRVSARFGVTARDRVVLCQPMSSSSRPCG